MSKKASKNHSSGNGINGHIKLLLGGMVFLLGFSLVAIFVRSVWKAAIIFFILAAIVYAIRDNFRKGPEEIATPEAAPEVEMPIAAEPVPVQAPIVPEVLPKPAPSVPAPIPEQPVVPRKSVWQIMEEEREAREEAIKAAIEEKKAEFDAALSEIPKVEIPLSEPVERRRLKDMPEYTFSNITRKTRLDSIFPLVILDVETTGFAPSKCEIVEVAAIKFDRGMEPVSAFTTLCKPRKPIPEEASAVNHITDDMVADAPAFNQIAPALTEFLKGCHIAGHNLDFDLRFIFAHGADFPSGTRFYDTMDLAHLTIPESQIWNYKLKTICSYYGIIPNESHRSLSDAYATSKVFSHLVLDKTDRQLDDNEEILSEKDAE